MAFKITEMLGCEFPLFAFSHCRDVVVAVTRAGGFGVLGGASYTPESLQEELAWIDSHVDGKPYGVDLLFPENLPPDADRSMRDIAASVSQQHKTFARELLKSHNVDVDFDEPRTDRAGALRTERTRPGDLLEVAFNHPIKLIVNALGIAPPDMIEAGKKAGVPVGALVGAKEHAIRQVNAGVDLIVAQGTEAGGHCGEVSTMVLVPEVVRAVNKIKPGLPVLAAGGIVTGRQMAAAMAMGAAGVWTGSVWLATTDAETTPIFREKMVAARSRDTIRSTFRTGKPSRQLKSAWHDAWNSHNSPGYLPMPHMGVISHPAFTAIDKAAASGDPEARELVSYFVGQGVGLIDQVSTAKSVVEDFRTEFAEALGEMMELAE
ncbi:MAG: nitronate monooxygenase [Phenylobacterium sp.]